MRKILFPETFSANIRCQNSHHLRIGNQAGLSRELPEVRANARYGRRSHELLQKVQGSRERSSGFRSLAPTGFVVAGAVARWVKIRKSATNADNQTRELSSSRVLAGYRAFMAGLEGISDGQKHQRIFRARKENGARTRRIVGRVNLFASLIGAFFNF